MNAFFYTNAVLLLLMLYDFSRGKINLILILIIKVLSLFMIV